MTENEKKCVEDLINHPEVEDLINHPEKLLQIRLGKFDKNSFMFCFDTERGNCKRESIKDCLEAWFSILEKCCRIDIDLQNSHHEACCKDLNKLFQEKGDNLVLQIDALIDDNTLYGLSLKMFMKNDKKGE